MQNFCAHLLPCKLAQELNNLRIDQSRLEGFKVVKVSTLTASREPLNWHFKVSEFQGFKASRFEGFKLEPKETLLGRKVHFGFLYRYN